MLKLFNSRLRLLFKETIQENLLMPMLLMLKFRNSARKKMRELKLTFLIQNQTRLMRMFLMNALEQNAKSEKLLQEKSTNFSLNAQTVLSSPSQRDLQRQELCFPLSAEKESAFFLIKFTK